MFMNVFGLKAWRRKRTRAEKMGLLIDSLRARGMKIGENVALYNCIFDTNLPFLIEIGSNCIVTHATVLAHDAGPLLFKMKSIVGRVRILDNCFVGAGAVIMPGVTVGPNAIVGANAVVTRDVPPGSIAAGNPARVISDVTSWLMREGADNVSRKWVEAGFNTLIPTDDELSELAKRVEQLIREGGL